MAKVKNRPKKLDIIQGYDEKFVLTIMNKFKNGDINPEPNLTNVKLIIYNNKTLATTLKTFDFSSGVSFDANTGKTFFEIDHNSPDVFGINTYFYRIVYVRTGSGNDAKFAGSFEVTAEGDCSCDELTIIDDTVEIAEVNGLRAELDNLAGQTTRLSSSLWQIDGSNSGNYIINAPDADFTVEPPIYVSVWKDGSLIPFVYSGAGIGLDIYDATQLYLKNYSYGSLNLANAIVQILYNKV